MAEQDSGTPVLIWTWEMCETLAKYSKPDKIISRKLFQPLKETLQRSETAAEQGWPRGAEALIRACSSRPP